MSAGCVILLSSAGGTHTCIAFLGAFRVAAGHHSPVTYTLFICLSIRCRKHTAQASAADVHSLDKSCEHATKRWLSNAVLLVPMEVVKVTTHIVACQLL